MSDKRKSIFGPPVEPQEFELEEVPVEQEVAPIVEPPKKYYEPFSWKASVNGHRCIVCGHCESGEGSEDRIILHVLKHVPESEQNALLDKLVKEKK